MEQIIEFPIAYEDMFNGAAVAREGYCICYQHGVDNFGYGPYGFDTKKASVWLKQTFPALVYWQSDRQEFIDVDVPVGRGLYLLKDQPYVRKTSQELAAYKREQKRRALRLRYKGELEDSGNGPIPAILMVSGERLFPTDFLAVLLEEMCSFFIYYSLIPYTGQTIVSFDFAMREKMKETAAVEGTLYQRIGSIDQVKPW
ncbi:hypothetical protein [Pseudomonas sp. NPDC088444]|uniref:hypothetical protein n=1 Tax=Pseudomonas sp. NPDC088444 TaxID=3364456 RepID=UPI00384C955D